MEPEHIRHFPKLSKRLRVRTEAAPVSQVTAPRSGHSLVEEEQGFDPLERRSTLPASTTFFSSSKNHTGRRLRP